MTRSNQPAKFSAGRCKKLATVVASIVCLAAALAPAAVAKPMPSFHGRMVGLQQDVDAVVAAGAPGAILLVRDGKHTTRLTAGVGNIAKQTPMRPSDHFKIASLTKTYTAAVVLQLVGEGKLRLADTVERWLPGLVPNGDGITIRQLLNHTSGLADFEDNPSYLLPYLSGDFGYYWSPRELVLMGVSQEPFFAPGNGWAYSNTNYVIAQLIVEEVTGKLLGVELKQRIFQPLRLRQTSYPTEPGLPSPYAHGYMLLGEPPLTDVTGLSPSLAPGSGGIVSTVRDVADFYRALLSGRVLKPSLLQAMKTTVSESSGEATSGPGYGLGIARTASSCAGWGHSGELPGYDVSPVSSEDGRRQVVLMINQDATTLPEPALELYFRLAKKAFCGV